MKISLLQKTARQNPRDIIKKLFNQEGCYINRYSDTVKNVMICRLPPQEHLEKYLADNLIEFRHNGFQSIVVSPCGESNIPYISRFNGNDYFKFYKKFCFMANDFFMGKGDLFFTVVDGKLGILLNYPMTDSETEREITMNFKYEVSSLLNDILESSGKKLLCAIGPAYQDIYLANYSTTAAEGMIDYLLFSSLPKSVLTQYDIGEYAFSVSAEDRKMELEIRYHYLASEGMFIRAKEVLNEIIDIEQSTYILPFHKICENAINHINYLFLSNGINSTNTHGMPSEYWKTNITSLMRSASPDELKKNTAGIFDSLESCFEREPTGQSKKTERFIQYIDDHYSDPNLNVEMLCRNFEINPSYLSRVFKKETDKGVLEHIHQRRVNEAKRLLSESDIHISEIAVLCGFWGRRAFDTVFKRIVGITPHQYRAAHKK